MNQVGKIVIAMAISTLIGLCGWLTVKIVQRENAKPKRPLTVYVDGLRYQEVYRSERKVIDGREYIQVEELPK